MRRVNVVPDAVSTSRTARLKDANDAGCFDRSAAGVAVAK
jgi:hypothetical protein